MKKYSSQNGLMTKKWGKPAWDTFFSMILGSYPYKLDRQNKEHLKIEKAFISLFNNLKWTLPCNFCKKSYCSFYNKIPIKNYTSGRIELMFWLYLIKNEVNSKLLTQEKDKLKELKGKCKLGEITKKEYSIMKAKVFKTKKSPSFITVLDKYEKIRANSCNK